jgi:hypothetical protein
MSLVRNNCAAVTLNGGQMFVTGGLSGATSGTVLASTEVYDPKLQAYVRYPPITTCTSTWYSSSLVTSRFPYVDSLYAHSLMG